MAGYQPMPQQQYAQSFTDLYGQYPGMQGMAGQQPMRPPFAHGGAAMPTTGPSGMYDPHGNRLPMTQMGPQQMPQQFQQAMQPPMGMDPNGKMGGMGGGMPGRQPMMPPPSPFPQAQARPMAQQIGQVASSLGPPAQQPFSPIRNEGYGQQPPSQPFSPIRREGYRNA